MLEEILTYLNNWFVSETYSDTYTVQDGSIELPFLQEGQYYRIIGSVFNDGLHQYGDELEDETFDGTIWALAIPRVILSITAEIEEWQSKYGDAAMSPYTSESFGGYSYSKGAGSEEQDWRSVFQKRLAPYRKLRELTGVEGTAYQDPGYIRPFNPDFPWR